MKIILVDPNLVRTFFGNIYIFFDSNCGAHPLKQLFFVFLVRTRLGCLR